MLKTRRHRGKGEREKELRKEIQRNKEVTIFY
jgi:hypothetical protein